MQTPIRRFYVMLAAVTLLIDGVGFARADEKPTEWSIYRNENYQLFYKQEREKDAEKVRGFLDAGIESLRKEFTDFPVDDLLRVNPVIYLHPKATDKASEYTTTITTGVDKGKYYAVIDLLTPSAYNPKYRNNIKQPADDDHFHKLVVHEYSTILVERITRAKKTGWTFFTAPRWFTDGYEEYLGITCSSPRNRKEFVEKYLAKHEKARARVSFDFGIGVEDDYIDGSLLLLFMHETFGKKRVQAVLTSGEPRFGTAMARELGIGLEEFKKRWDEWLEKKLN
jgi:hypothetical protein